MALRGKLRDFSLPDVFQLVTFSKKTGVLRITREDGAEGSVWFRDGDVFFASSNWHNEPIGERLVKAQRVTQQALDKALQVRAEEGPEGRRLGQILIDEGYITEKVLETFVSDQIQDTIFDLMRWDDGDFDFEAMPEVVDEDIGLSVSIENVVMEGARRLEEWNRIRKKIPSTDVVFKMATAPGEGTYEISLKPIEWQLLLLVDGTRSVAELAHETGRTDFDVARIVYGLFSAGLLEFATDEEVERNRAERAEREARAAAAAAERLAAEEAARQAAEEAERQAAEEAAQRAAEEVERLAAEEAERLEAEREATEAERLAAEEAEREAAAAAAVPAEVPEFLAGTSVAPTAEDEAVLEEFMGAVLQQPAEPAEEADHGEVEPAPAPEPHVPAEEPAFISAPALEPQAEPGVPVPTVEELLGIEIPSAHPIEQEEPERPGEAAEIERPEPETAEKTEPLLPEPQGEVAEIEQPEPEAAEEQAPAVLVIEEVAVTEAALEIEFVEIEEAPPEVGAIPVVEELDLSETDVIAPAEEQAESFDEPLIEPESTFEHDLLALGLGEAEPPQPDVAEQPEMAEAAAAPVSEPTAEQEEPDFAELLESLDLDADLEVATEAAAATHGGAAEQPLIAPVEAEHEEHLAEEAGFDAELLEQAPSAAGGGVISTDAYLEDISMSGLGLTGGLTAEISALTGVDRPSARPQASVNPIPESGAALRRDLRVDKDTLLKIIDGIEKL